MQNGRVLKAFALTGERRNLDAQGEIEVRDGGWILLRAWNDGADPALLDLYPYATTSPIWLESPQGPPPAPADAAYFVTWIEKTMASAAARDDYNTPQEKKQVMDYLQQALDRYRGLAGTKGRAHEH